MCGITAFSRAVERSSIFAPGRFMQAALLAIENRGTDATGYAYMNADSKGWYWKKAVAAHEAAFSAPFPGREAQTAIGHTRWATQGSKHKPENNHPVIDDGVMLVHNGIITNDKEIYRWLDPDYPPKAEVDTAAFAALLAHPEEVFADHPTDLLAMVAGSAAFAWIMTEEPEALHLARTTNERPLTIGWTRLGDLVMSSTPTTLADLSGMSGIRIRKFREVGEGTYLKVIGGEIVEEQSFRPCRSYQYNNSHVTSVKWIGGVRHVKVGDGEWIPEEWQPTKPSPPVGTTAKPGEKIEYYVSNPDGVCIPVVESDALVKYEPVRDRDDFWARVWAGEDIADLLDDVEYENEDLAKDLTDELIQLHLDKHSHAHLTVIEGEKGKPFDQDKLRGKTEVDKDQLEYEQYLDDMDEIDWYEVVPRRGWADRKESAADDVSAALSREDR